MIIAEKPSVATDISKALGGFKKQEDFYESENYVLSSAVGHLLQLAVPPGVEAAKGKWSFAKLPVIPPHFDLAPIEKSQDLLDARSRSSQHVLFLCVTAAICFRIIAKMGRNFQTKSACPVSHQG